MTGDQQRALSICHPRRWTPHLGKRSSLFSKEQTFHFLVQLFSFSALLRTIYRKAGKTYRNSPLPDPILESLLNEYRLHTVGQKVQLLLEKEEKVFAGAIVGVLKAGLLNFPPSLLRKSGPMTSLHLSAGVSRMALIPNSVLVTHRCIYSSFLPCPAPSDNPLR